MSAAEPSRRRMWPPASQKLERRLEYLRREMIKAAEGGKSGGKLIYLAAREWLHLAFLKIDLGSPGDMLSESDRSAQVLPWMIVIPPEEDGKEATMALPTLQEHRDFHKHIDWLDEQIKGITSDIDIAKDHFPSPTRFGGEPLPPFPSPKKLLPLTKEEFLVAAKARRLALMGERRRLANLGRDPDLSGMSESDRALEAKRLRHERLHKARRLLWQGDTDGARRHEALARIVDFDAKQCGMYYTSICSGVNISTFDYEEESPIGPMRFTRRAFKDELFVDYAGINILSVKIACSDIGFPIQVYGTVIARDCIDYKRVYLFHCDRDHCQLINSEEEALILIGPKRGLALSHRRENCVETDLWVKDHQGHCIQFSKGIALIRGTETRILEKCEAETVSVATRLSTVDVIYEVVKCVVEATIAVEVIEEEFHGVIAGYNTSSKSRLVLYDSSKVAAGGNCSGVIQLMRPAILVYVMDKLIISLETTAGDSIDLNFTPFWNGRRESILALGDATMCVQVAWSMMA